MDATSINMEAARPPLSLTRSPTTSQGGVTYEGLPVEPGIQADFAERGQQSNPADRLGGEPDAGVPSASPVPAHLHRCHPHPFPAEQHAWTFLRLTPWLAVLWAGFGIQRSLCAAGLPYDCQAMTALDLYSALTALAFVGGGLGWLVDAARPARFAWLAARRQAYVWLAYVGTLPAYSALSNIPALQSSLYSGGVALTPGMLAVFAAVGSSLLCVAAFHLWLALQPEICSDTGSLAAPAADEPADGEAPSPVKAAPVAWRVPSPRAAFPYWRRVAPAPSSSSLSSSNLGKQRSRLRRRKEPLSWRVLGLYMLPRLAVLAYFGAWLGALAGSGSFELHLHHYALGWAAASLAAFNHPVSGLLLALGTAVFVQGVGAYGMDPLLKPASQGGCLPASSNSTGQMVCAFWAADPFSLRFCSDTPWIPWFDCTVPWPWPATAVLGAASSSGGGAVEGAAQALRGGALPASTAAPAPFNVPLGPAAEPDL